MKTQVHLLIQANFSKQLEIRIEPVNRTDENETAVAEKVFGLLEQELKCSKLNVVEGLEQIYVDYELEGKTISLRADPWYFLALGIADDELRKKIFDRLSGEFEVVPLPPQDGDDE